MFRSFSSSNSKFQINSFDLDCCCIMIEDSEEEQRTPPPPLISSPNDAMDIDTTPPTEPSTSAAVVTSASVPSFANSSSERQPPPGPITSSMSPTQVKDNLIRLARSNPSPEEVAAKVVEFADYLSSTTRECDRASIAKALISHLFTLVDFKDRGIELKYKDNSALLVWIRKTFPRIDDNNPSYVVTCSSI